MSASEGPVAVSSDENDVVAIGKPQGKGQKAPEGKGEPPVNGADKGKGKSKTQASHKAKPKGKAALKPLDPNEVEVRDPYLDRARADANIPPPPDSTELQVLRERNDQVPCVCLAPPLHHSNALAEADSGE